MIDACRPWNLPVPPVSLYVLGLPGQEVALFKDLVVISIGVGTISMGFRGLGHSIDQPIHLASTGHVVQHRISLIIRG
jgi:hypothetical protein